jgi:hypothetical protein
MQKHKMQEQNAGEAARESLEITNISDDFTD